MMIDVQMVANAGTAVVSRVVDSKNMFIALKSCLLTAAVLSSEPK